ncbi:hypothetical protein HBI56_005530 [Parastagonospora nodorum]|uniref:G protein-coupled receptor GPR1/2/3 C-terminal domain-containing protein n=1 Tax=Phaeosphaeria nodorum (strain SN15 / ATCC MYA-4574 / FGSC 10173) TaxID=321614 RepID=A0A7U2HWZ5_PHANO|nr:hypothetical protein HBH56_124140 [Parastagonospora nodorum]QRC91182.1 hypothetical protein JI435_006830 [Parastagonospora nodorum SN15]KAH3935255.1 hypothetical protein HBH54_049680 [Parastagonospora nodorum]KAH3950265.1 hypothetical protein HBH53_079680 [Parastagonospora nodorum]KAH3982645.1 hypothetical protein HBH51_037450 [Parastagonospora nodorum]
MPHMPPLDTQSASFILPPHIHPWLRAVVAFGFISFIASISLLVVLTYKLVSWKLKSKRSNQFVILIFNLLWADIQQALAFLLNVEWLRLGSVQIENPICFAQGWLVSTGDLGSGVWCFAIGLHTFASVILDYRMSPKLFYTTIIALWLFIMSVSAIPVGLHGQDIYVRSGVWCWIHHELNDLRLWTHYIWIFVFEFGTVIIYLTIYTILLHRLHNHYYTPAAAKRVKSISNLMVVYPLVYVVCTIPLASSRMAAMSGSPPSLVRLCLSGAMITSNGWLDVLLYTLTRRIMIFSDEPPPDDNGFDTFSTFWATQPRRFGGECTISADGVTLPSCNESSDDLCNTKDIKLVTTTEVKSEPAGPEDFAELERRQRPRTPIGRWSEDSGQLSLKLEDFESSRSGTPR